MDDKLTPADAGAIASRARKLLRLGKITHHQLTLVDALLWTCRRAGAATVRVSYGQIQAAAHMARSTVAAGLAVLERLGLIERTRHRILVIGANGGRVWKQLTSTYRLLTGSDSREFDRRTDFKAQEVHIRVDTVPNAAAREAQEALKRIAEGRAAQRAAAWLRQRRPA
jgi:DNA-binding MarR family transcriptional regulator